MFPVDVLERDHPVGLVGGDEGHEEEGLRHLAGAVDPHLQAVPLVRVERVLDDEDGLARLEYVTSAVRAQRRRRVRNNGRRA